MEKELEYFVVYCHATNISLAVITSDCDRKHHYKKYILTYCGLSHYTLRPVMIRRLFICVHSSIDSLSVIVFTERKLNPQHLHFKQYQMCYWDSSSLLIQVTIDRQTQKYSTRRCYCSECYHSCCPRTVCRHAVIVEAKHGLSLSLRAAHIHVYMYYLGQCNCVLFVW